MVADHARTGECDLCGRDLPESPVEADGGAFCCDGCRSVHVALGDRAEADERGRDEVVEGSRGEGDDEPASRDNADDALVRTFLGVEGMASVTCEAFLEAAARGCDGVEDAAASYVTGTVRVDHDPGRTTAGELAAALSRAGYDAVPRDAADAADATPAGERGMDDLLGFRYAFGVLFAAFLLLPYVVMVYPVNLAALLGDGALTAFVEGLGFGGDRAFAVLPMFLTLTGVVLLFSGLPVLRGAYVALVMRRPNTDLLVTLTVVAATLYSTVAAILGRVDLYFDLAVTVAAVVVAATFYESLVKRRALDRLTDLTVSQVEEALLYEADGTTREVAVEELSPGDCVLVREGERVPVDGSLAEGEPTVDEAVVTGESLPVVKRPGDEVVGGSVVTDGAAVVAVGEAVTSGIRRLTAAVWDLQSATHGGQRRADRIAGVVVPAVVGLAVVVGAARLALGAAASSALLSSLTILLVACPWAVGLSTPLSVAASVREALERGVVVFDETVFERLREVDVVVFDKTGTLTTGEMAVVEADAPEDLLAATAALERRASHPAAAAIADAFGSDAGDGASEAGEDAPDAGDGGPAATDGGVADERDAGPGAPVEEFRSHARGVEGVVDGTRSLVGHPDLFAERDWSVPGDVTSRAGAARDRGRLPVVVGREGRAEGVVVVGDEPRDGWERTVDRLADRGMGVVVLTGDDEAAAERFRRHAAVDHVFAGVPPDGKTATVRLLRADGRVAMVGDGTNDAPAIAAADLGVALGGGTALASEAADVAVVDDDLARVETAFDLAGAARGRVVRDDGIALLYNAVAVPLAVAGLLNPLFVILAVAATGGLLAANASRPLVVE